MTASRRLYAGLSGVCLALVGTLALGACSTQSTPAKPSTQPASQATQEPIGGNTLPPVMVKSGQTEAAAKVGDNIVFEVADVTAWTISSDNPSVVSVMAGSDDGTVQMNPGGQALSAGTATVTLENSASKEPWVVTIMVNP